MLRPTAFAVLLLAGAITASHAQTTSTSGITVENAWARATPGNVKTGAVYMTVLDRGAATDRLVGVSSPVAARAELHSMSNDGGVMKMQHVDAVPVAPGTPTELKPGGYHIMLMELKHPLKEGDSVPMTLRFEKAGSVEVMAKVEKPGAMAPSQAMNGMKKM